MTRSKGIRPFHYKNKIPADPRIKPIKRWPPSNRGCYDGFRKWMRATGLSEITVGVYGIGARFALGYLDKPYWAIDPEEDLAEVWAYLNAQHPHSPRLRHYRKGLKKFAQYLYLRSDKVKPQKSINWSHYTAGLPDSLDAQIRAFLKHWQRRWPEERQYEGTLSLLSHLTHSLRWMAQQLDFAGIADICPRNWYAYVDLRLAKGISPVTLNGELRMLGQLLR
ncbi:MAG: hypothetical protein JW862_19525, partial [Anaerolineales bacterium]|nr:hypothetical protein [Anaerolineales bacterium]